MFVGDPGDLHPWLKIAIEDNTMIEPTAQAEQRLPKELENIPAHNVRPCSDANLNIAEISPPSIPTSVDSQGQDHNYIYVELDSEVEFFNMLTTDMNNAMALSEQVQREQFETDVSKLEKQIAVVVCASLFHLKFVSHAWLTLDALTTP